MSEGKNKLLFQPWQVVVEPAFWGKLGDFKLKILKLEEGPIEFSAEYHPNNHPDIPGSLQVTHIHETNFIATKSTSDLRSSRISGDLYCLNTIERLIGFDRQNAVSRATQQILQSIQDGSCLTDTSKLQRMICLCYCDLKHHKYHHWFAFPVLLPSVPYTLASPAVSLLDHFNGKETFCHRLLTSIQDFQQQTSTHNNTTSSSHIVMMLETTINVPNDITTGITPHDDHDDESPLIQCRPLTSLVSPAPTDNNNQSMAKFLVIPDTSNAPEYPGWSLRNILFMISTKYHAHTSLHVLCLRSRKGRLSPSASRIFHVCIPPTRSSNDMQEVSSTGGWHLNPQGLHGPRLADLSSMMDPHLLAASAVDLNLRLMKWRASPTLDIDSVSSSKCLLLGAGTLGCSVARTLLGWGVRRITFVDNSRVSYSNPVRQSLFEFEDCLEGGRAKAQAAAGAIQKIFPAVQSKGIELSIPMPGHPPANEEEAMSMVRGVRALHEMIEQHDVVFLLLDTREARWLPTVVCAATGKLAITGALGFDSFVVMRHGGRIPLSSDKKKSIVVSDRLGCYFCNDIIGPSNSTADITLDQQCTVARPGLSALCGAMSVEMMAAVLQHPKGVDAPPPPPPPSSTDGSESLTTDDHASTPVSPALGHVPHMIRGQLTGFSQMILTGRAFSQCPACSECIVHAYLNDPSGFVLNAVSHPAYLEDLTGLTELHQLGDAVIQAATTGDGRGTERGGGEGIDDWEEL